MKRKQIAILCLLLGSLLLALSIVSVIHTETAAPSILFFASVLLNSAGVLAWRGRWP